MLFFAVRAENAGAASSGSRRTVSPGVSAREFYPRRAPRDGLASQRAGQCADGVSPDASAGRTGGEVGAARRAAHIPGRAAIGDLRRAWRSLSTIAGLHPRAGRKPGGLGSVSMEAT